MEDCWDVICHQHQMHTVCPSLLPYSYGPTLILVDYWVSFCSWLVFTLSYTVFFLIAQMQINETRWQSSLPWCLLRLPVSQSLIYIFIEPSLTLISCWKNMKNCFHLAYKNMICLFGVKPSNTYIWLKHMKNMFRVSVQQNPSFNLWTIVWTLVCVHVCVWLLVYFCFVC